MSKEVKAKVKALFPENVEGIYISKNDYDRLYGDLTLENIELKQEIERLNNIINELEEYLKSFLYMLNGILDRDIYEQCQLDDFTQIMDKLQELRGSDKE